MKKKFRIWRLLTWAGEGARFSIDFKGYRSGHMMYLRKEDLETSNNDIREFIEHSIPEQGRPAKY